MLTLQRAAHLTEAQAHGDLLLPPLLQTLPEWPAELEDPGVVGWCLAQILEWRGLTTLQAINTLRAHDRL